MRGSERRIYWTGLLVRCFLGLSAWSLSEYTGLVLVEDAALYEHQGARIAQEWMAHGSSETLALILKSGREAWVMYWLLAVFSFLLGGARALPVLIVLFNLVTAWVPVYTYRIALLLGVSSGGATRAARLVIFSPVFAFWAGALYKEGLVLLALNVIVYEGLVLQKEWRLRSILVLIGGLILLLGLRFYVAALLVPPLLAGLVLGKTTGFSLLRRGLALGSIAVGLIVIGFVSRMNDLLPQDSWDLLAQIQESRNDLASALGLPVGRRRISPRGGVRVSPGRCFVFPVRASPLGARFLPSEPGHPGNAVLAFAVSPDLPRNEGRMAYQSFGESLRHRGDAGHASVLRSVRRQYRDRLPPPSTDLALLGGLRGMVSGSKRACREAARVSFSPTRRQATPRTPEPALRPYS